MSGAVLLMDMGTGKTLTTIAVMGRAYLNEKIKKVLVVCPASVVPVWEKEIEQYADFENTVITLEGTMIKRNQKLKELVFGKGLKVAVINYESTWRMFDDLKEWCPDMIICDESQRIKNHTAAQSKAMHKLGDIAKYKMLLTGTPIQNNPLDVFSQYRFVDKTIYGTSFYIFRNRYVRMGGYGGHQVIGYINQDELIEKMHSIAYRVTKEEALDLPEEIKTMRYCELEPSSRKIYDQIKKECYMELEQGEITVTNVLTKTLRLRQITGGFINNDDKETQFVSNAKLDALEEIINDVVIDSNKKLVIFAVFLDEISAIKKLVESKGIKYSWITGQVKMDERGQMVDDFQNKDDVKVFICQTHTAGLGITLTAADTSVFYSVDFNYVDYTQAMARLHRIGQKNNVNHIHLIAKNTIDTRLMKVLDNKGDISTTIVDDWRKYFE